jgi:hypothetical protein
LLLSAAEHPGLSHHRAKCTAAAAKCPIPFQPEKKVFKLLPAPFLLAPGLFIFWSLWMEGGQKLFGRLFNFWPNSFNVYGCFGWLNALVAAAGTP